MTVMSTFRVLQFNIQFGQRWDAGDPDHAPINLEDTIAEIRSHSPDVMLLQEVERARPGGSQIEPPPNYQLLRAAFPDYHGCFAYPKPDPRELPFGLGLAILSRTPLCEIFRQDVVSPPVEFDFKGETLTPTDRVLLGAQTTLHGRNLMLLNTHLLAFFMLNSSSEVHGIQRQILTDRLRDLHGPALLSGDFNVSRHESLVTQFAEVGFTSAQTTEPTWWRKPYVLDHIFYNEHLRCTGHQVSPTEVSDHRPLVADFEFR